MEGTTRPLASASSALQLVTLLGERERVRVTEVAQELGVAPSTAYRLLATFCHWGFAIQDDDHTYVIGQAFVRLSLMKSPLEALQSMVKFHMDKFAASAGETVHLSMLEGTSVRFVHSAEGRGNLRVSSRAGAELPAHLTSAGKVLLAELSDEEVQSRFLDVFPTLLAGKTRTMEEFLGELATVRERGFAINIDESEPGISAVGIALRHRRGEAIAALSVSIPSTRFRMQDLPRLLELLRQAGRYIEQAV
jgi:IclR family transcriptional regulator, acetate operon repressor